MIELPIDGDPVLNLAVFVFGNDMTGHELMRIGVRALGDDVVGAARIDPGKRSQVVLRGLIEVHRPLAAQAFLHALSHGLGIALDRCSLFRGLLADLVWTLVGTSKRKA